MLFNYKAIFIKRLICKLIHMEGKYIIFGTMAALFACSSAQTNRRSITPRSLDEACDYIENHNIGPNDQDSARLVSDCSVYIAFTAYESQTRNLLVSLSLGYSAMLAMDNGITDIDSLGVRYSGPDEISCSSLQNYLRQLAFNIEDSLPRAERELENQAPKVVSLRQYMERQTAIHSGINRIRRQI